LEEVPPVNSLLESLGILSDEFSVDYVVTSKSLRSHLQSIFLSYDPTFNPRVSATKPGTASRERGGVMKKNLEGMVVLTILAAMVVTMGSTVPMFAQASGPMKVTVPFNFVVENDRLQAGEYTIERIANGRLRIHSSDGKVSTSFIAIPAQGQTTAEQAHFIFHRYGGEYFLAKIWTPGQNVGWEVMQGKLETELARKKTVPVETATLIGH
jgi:hypothetical protein